MIRAGKRTSLMIVWAALALLLSVGHVSGNERQERVKRYRSLLREAQRTFNAGEYDSAQVLLESVRELEERNPDAYYQLGRIHLVRADSVKAISILSEGVAVAPLSTRIKLLLARLKIARAEFDQAESLLNQILSIKPREGEALFLRGSSRLARGDTLQALDDWKKALARSIQESRR